MATTEQMQALDRLPLGHLELREPRPGPSDDDWRFLRTAVLDWLAGRG